MTAIVEGVTFDAVRPLRVARFWAAALEWDLDEPSRALSAEDDPDYAGVVDPASRGLPFGFVRVPEPKTVKNRMHFDLSATLELDDEIARLTGLGATPLDRHREAGYTWMVMQDPEGNEFCVGVLSPD